MKQYLLNAIMEIFNQHPYSIYSVTDISNALDAHRQTIMLYIDELEKQEKIIKVNRPNKVYWTKKRGII